MAQELCVAFVDKIDFFSSREDVKQRIDDILKEYKLLFKATSRKIQFYKTFYFR